MKRVISSSFCYCHFKDDQGKFNIVEERNSRAGSGGLSPERGGILGSVIWTLVLSTPLRNIYCYMVPEVDC